MVNDHPQGGAVLDTEDHSTSVADTLAAVEQICAVNIPDLAVVLSPDIAGMAQLLAAIRRAVAQLKWADEQLEDEIVKVMRTKEEQVPGLGTIEMRTGSSRKGWDKDGLNRALTQVIAGDLTPVANVETGEVIAPQRIVETVLSQYLVAATPNWKSTGLRQFGINPDDYCEVTWGRKSITTPKVEIWTGENTDA